MCKTIKQKVRFSTPPNDVYHFLADRKKVGRKFSEYSGRFTGMVVDLAPGKRIVEAWRSKQFPDGIFSMAAITLSPTKNGGTELVLTHRGVPKDLIPSVEAGWRQLYWEKIKTVLKKADV